MTSTTTSPDPTSVAPTSTGKVFDLFPNTKPSNGKYVGVISGLLRNMSPRDVLSSSSPFNKAGAVHDAAQDAANTSSTAAASGTDTTTSPNNNINNASFGATTGSGSAPNSPSRHSPLDILISLCNDVKKVLDDESVIINVKVNPNDRLVLVGDIHGQFRDLQRHVLSHQREASGACSATNNTKNSDTDDNNNNEEAQTECGANNNNNVSAVPDCKYLFLGDYVDRGPQGVEVITLLLALKVEYPNNVFMIRGNHEDAQVSRLYGFLTECKSKLDVSSWSHYNEVFNSLPLGATVECENGTIFCCHGGLSPMVEHVASLQFLNRAEYGSGLADDGGEAIDGLLWSDPGEHKGFRRNMRGCGYTFGPDTTRRFCEDNGLMFVCRAHQMVMSGYQWEHDHKLLTLFSAPNYCGINHNDGAIGIVMGSEAHANYLAKRSKNNNNNNNEGLDNNCGSHEEEEEAAKAAAGITIPIVFEAFASAPTELCTLYYYNAHPNAAAAEEATLVTTDDHDDVSPDANGSPVMSSLSNQNLPSAGAVAIDGGEDDNNNNNNNSVAAPLPNPNSNIEGLTYFKEE